MSELIKLSVSKTKTFLDCKAKYKFSYILKLPKKERDYHIFGKFCHSVLETFHKEYINGCLLPFHITMTDAFKKALTEYKGKMTPEMKKECWDIIYTYLKNISKKSETSQKKTNLPGNVIDTEKQFNFNLTENVILNGAIDRIQIDDDDVIHIADYKTTKNKKYLQDDFFQLITYAFVILSENPDIDKIRASYILLRHDYEYITTEFSKDQILAVKDKYIDYANQMLTETEFPANPTFLCTYCDFYNDCDLAYGKQNTKFGETTWDE